MLGAEEREMEEGKERMRRELKKGVRRMGRRVEGEKVKQEARRLAEWALGLAGEEEEEDEEAEDGGVSV